MSLKKQYFKTKPSCKVTFTVPKQLAAFASTVHLVGDFNDWNKSITPMKRLKDGSFTATLFLRQDWRKLFELFPIGHNIAGKQPEPPCF
jgi:1,4-alpha-glucan branching enzyme